MNRATFFKTLGLGIVSAPAIAKVLAEPPKPMLSYGGPRLWVNSSQQYYIGELEWYCFKDGLLYGPDQKPMRFDNLDYDIKRVKSC